MNFNKYAYGDPDKTDKGGGNDSDGDMPCLNDGCCAEGLYYWKKKADPRSLCHTEPDPNSTPEN